MRIALLTSIVPTDRSSGAEIAVDEFVKALRAAGHDVRLVAYARAGRPSTDPAVIVAEERAIETATAPRGQLLRWITTALVRRMPYSLAKFHGTSFARVARKIASESDLVIVGAMQVAWILDELPPRSAVVIAHNVEHRLYGPPARGWRQPLGAAARRRERRLLQRTERWVAERAAGIWTLTGDDGDYFRSLPGAAAVRAFALPSDTSSPPPDPAPREGVAVLGTWSWAPNAAGLRWFLDEVRPHLGQDVVVDIGGRDADWCASLPGVRYHGFVPDARSFLARARVVALPSTEGSGLQIKTLDALALGSWMVATTTAMRGITGADDLAVVTDEPRAFAEGILRLLGDPATETTQERAVAWSRDRAARFGADVAEAARGAGGRFGHRAPPP